MIALAHAISKVLLIHCLPQTKEINMSHDAGFVFSTHGNLLGFFEYNGTVDLVQPLIHQTRQKLDEHWRKDPPKEAWTDSCSNQQEILLYLPALNLHWRGKACLQCKKISEGLQPYEYDLRVHVPDCKSTGAPGSWSHLWECKCVSEGHPFPLSSTDKEVFGSFDCNDRRG
jgi:hypothetical protein